MRYLVVECTDCPDWEPRRCTTQKDVDFHWSTHKRIAHRDLPQELANTLTQLQMRNTLARTRINMHLAHPAMDRCSAYEVLAIAAILLDEGPVEVNTQTRGIQPVMLNPVY